MQAIAAQLERVGYAITEPLIGAAEIEAACRAAEPLLAARTGKSGGVRWAVDREPALAALLNSAGVRRVLDACALRRPLHIARSILFDKTPTNNWLVPWHQDTTISVRERVDVPGFTAWAERDGRVQCDPPAWVLDAMFTLRLHLDECGEEHGALVVLPGSHGEGLLSEAEIERRTAAGGSVTCAAMVGSAVVMKPLILHRSSKARLPSRRRVLHVEFATCELPGGLRWPESTVMGAAAR